jgi:hypothetical protein
MPSSGRRRLEKGIGLNYKINPASFISVFKKGYESRPDLKNLARNLGLFIIRSGSRAEEL